MRGGLVPLALGLGLLLADEAAAQGLGESADVELLSPGTGARALPGPMGADQRPRGTVRTGAFVQYARNPLVLWRLDTNESAGAVVGHRWTTVLGAAVYLDRRVLLEARLPSMLQWGNELPEQAGDGFGLGDAALRGNLLFQEGERGRLGAALEVLLPTAPRGAWMGEAEPRLRPGLGAAWQPGAVELLGSAVLDLRTRIDDGQSFAMGSRLALDGGLRVCAVEALCPFASVLGRLPLEGSADAGAAEALLGLQAFGGEGLQADLGVGRGLDQGYGTTALRAFVGLSWTPRRGEDPERIEVADLEPEPEPEPQPEPEPEPEDTLPEAEPEEEDEGWEEERLARIMGERIEIREPIQFELGTARILPESLPVLQQVAWLLLEDPRIIHLVVEGHASPEGQATDNYDLSIRRARAVWEELVRAGVHVDRLSYRGMGEALPAEGTAADLAASRRVEFHIVRQLYEGEEAPSYRDSGTRPWGEGEAPPAESGAP